MKSKKILALTMAATIVVGGIFTSRGNKNDNAKINEKTKANQGDKVDDTN